MKFVWKVMPRNEGNADKEKPPLGGGEAAQAAPGRVKLSEIGADLKDYVEVAEKTDPQKKKEISDKAQQWDKTDNVDEIRRAGITAAENEKDPLKKHEMLSALFLERDKKNQSKMSFKVDFKGNSLAERRVGAGDLLPPTAKAVRVQYQDGRVIERAVRAINPATGRIGYYDENLLKQGVYQYVPVFSGSTVDVLETQTAESFEVKRRLFAENMEIYNPPKRTASFAPAGGMGSGIISRSIEAGNYGSPRSSLYNNPSLPPRIDFKAPTAGYMEIEGKQYEAVDRNFWRGIGGERYVQNIDPVTNEPITFMGAKFASGTNILVLPYLKEAEARIRAAGINYNFYNAQSYSRRTIEGSDNLSYHSWGAAFDLNPADNGFKRSWDSLDPEKRIPPQVIQIMESLGFKWGGRWTGRPDPMHFEFAINPLTSTALLQSSDGQKYKTAILDRTNQPKEMVAANPKMQLQGPESGEMDPKLNSAIRSKLEPFRSMITEASQKYGVPENLIMAVIWQESGGNPSIASHAGAGGLMQLMPFIRDENGARPPTYPTIARGKGYSLDSRDWRNDPAQVIMAGTKMLSGLLKKYNGSIVLALAAYNAGSGRVDRAGGVPNIPETKQYVASIPRFYNSLNAEEKNQGNEPNKALA